MQVLISALKSNKIVTMLGLTLALAYVVPEFVENSHGRLNASLGIDRSLFPENVPVPAQKPGNLPAIKQPQQFDMSALKQALSKVDFKLARIRSGEPVPRFFVEQIPVDIVDVSDIEVRKRTFLKVVLPLVLSINEKIEARRNRLTALFSAKASGNTISPADQNWLENIARNYREDTLNPEALLKKVDAVPVSLALAQAVEESGWGTSRFAREGNALFGQRVWSSGKGIVPEDRDKGETHEVKAFKTLGDSIKAYIHNLNVHPAYAAFREERARRNTEPDMISYGHKLTETLLTYSERGQEYVDTLQSLIEANRLDEFENAVLAPERLADSSF
ncbi:MAG: glucosaminidase domain-containing protein [Sneathiella sp.]|nr:glucosaminidase domain-containing protein [Sneathiella sp.]